MEDWVQNLHLESAAASPPHVTDIVLHFPDHQNCTITFIYAVE